MQAEQHPSSILLERFMRNDTEPADTRTVVRHLLTGCLDCLKATRALWHLGDLEVAAVRERLIRPRPAPSNPGYDDVFDRLSRQASARAAHLDAQRQVLPQSLAQLEALSPGERVARVLSQTIPVGAPLAEAWLDRVESLLETRNPSAVAEAELGTLLTEKLDGGAWGETVIQALRCRAWGFLGEARRLAYDLVGADRALATAAALIATGERDDRGEAQALYLEARLRIDQHRFEEAGVLLEGAIAIHRRCGEQGLLSRALILDGALHHWIGKDPEALERLHESLDLLERQPAPRLRAEALYRLVPLIDDPDEALRVLRESRSLYQQVGDRPNLARLRRLEGKIEELRGDYTAAEAALNEARQGLLSEELGREAAQASLDLALLYARQGKAVDTHQIARWTLPVFSSASVQRDTIFALLALQGESESDRIDPDFIGEIARYLDPAPCPGRTGLSAVH
jgi:tetratricopeptide (TPR) repeat protein